MLVQTLALAFVLASPGSPPARRAVDAPPDNTVRARRGLLPRKIVRTRTSSRGRRVVLLPQAPTWLGEPAEPDDVAPLADAVEPAVAARVEPVSGDAASGEPPGTLGASLAGAEVELLLVRRFAPVEPPPLSAEVSGAELQVLVIRRLAP